MDPRQRVAAPDRQFVAVQPPSTPSAPMTIPATMTLVRRQLLNFKKLSEQQARVAR